MPWRSLRLFVPIVLLGSGLIWGEIDGLAESQSTSKAGTRIVSADVFLEVQKFREDLERLRRFMGAPRATPLDIRVSNAAPHDVYFQALTLFEKTNRFSFEVTRLQEQSRPTPREVFLPADVLELTKAAHRSLGTIMSDIEIPPSVVPLKRDPTTTPNDVFKAILSTNRQLNLLLERRFAPSDVYQKVTLAIGYTARQLARFPGVRRIPDEPPFEAEKRPTDVYFRLIGCLEIVSTIYEVAGIKALEINTSHIDEKSITPSDVFDVASLIVARLDFLHKKFMIRQMPREVFYSGRKYPSHVYQQTGILEKQLQQLKRFITAQR